MQVRIRLFAMQRQQVGVRAVAIELADGATVGQAWERLTREHPVLAPAGAVVRFARNGVYVGADERLADGDELAVIPPVSGGAPGERLRRLELHAAPFDDTLIAALHRQLARPEHGAVAIFVGQTRDTPGTPAPGQEAEAARFAGRRVEALEYEAFEPLVLTTFELIAEEVEERFDVRRLAILHRVGEVPLGEASVIVAAAAPHRDAAFAACRYAIEELKARAPIWKAERFADGSVWIGAPARTGPEPPRSR